MAYLDEFKAAVERTRGFGLRPPSFAPQHIAYLDGGRMASVPHALLREFGTLTANDLVAQCVSIHFRLLPVLEPILGVRPIFTIGHVSFNGKDAFKTTDEYLYGLLSEGLGGRGFDAHAWLTLPSMEIIDFSLPTSLAVINGLDEGIGGILSGHADHLKRGVSYHPRLVGIQYLFEIGAVCIAR